MGRVVFNMTMSLDGFVAGPNDRPGNGLGDGGDQLFKWFFSGNIEIPISDGRMMLKVSPQSAELLKEEIEGTGAEVWGRRTFDITGAWGGYPPMEPCFIVTHHVPQEWVKEGSPFTFVTDGIESAIRQAKKAAGNKNVAICTASILQQCINAGLLDDIHINLVPILLGRGVRLFDNLNTGPIELESIQVIDAPGATHLRLRVVKQESQEGSARAR